MQALDKHYQLYGEIQKLPKKIEELLSGSTIIKSDAPDAVEQLRAKIIKKEALQAEMKQANAYYRKNGTMQGYGNYTNKEAAELDEKIAQSCYNAPFGSFHLTNNNAEIKR